MATMYTTAKVNPLTGTTTDNNPKKEARQEKRQMRRDERALNKSLNEGIKKQGLGLKQYYKGIPVEETANTPKTKDWRDKAKADKGGKKGLVVKGGKGGRVNYKKMDESCKKPK
jgi:hypothetical protein